MPRAFLISKKKEKLGALTHANMDTVSICSDGHSDGHSDDHSDHSDVDIDVVGHDEDDDCFSAPDSPNEEEVIDAKVASRMLPQSQGMFTC